MLGKKILIAVIVVLLLGASGSSVYFYSQWKKAIQGPDRATEEEIISITKILSESIELPKDEEPTMATVVDREKLQDQEFFHNAENGDKVLIYANARKAILYRPGTEKIIEVAPVYFDQNQQTQTPPTTDTTGIDTSATTPAIVRVAYYNGSGIVGRAAQVESSVKGWFQNTETVTLQNAKGSYTTTRVVDLRGTMDTEVTEIATRLGGEKGELPSGEDRPDADILIIIGN